MSSLSALEKALENFQNNCESEDDIFILKEALQLSKIKLIREEQNVTVDGNVSGSVLVTGDNNKIHFTLSHPKYIELEGFASTKSSILSTKKLLFVFVLLLIVCIVLLIIVKNGNQTIPSKEIVEARQKDNSENQDTFNQIISTFQANKDFPTKKLDNDEVYANIGVTVFKVNSETKTVEDNERGTFDTIDFSRINDIANGDKVLIQIESLTGEFLPDKGGYLYVINQEEYADGSFSVPRLIFPTLSIYGGSNFIKPGELIILPSSKRPFIIKPINPEKPQEMEVYIIIIAPQPLPLPQNIGAEEMPLPNSFVNNIKKQFGKKIYSATLENGLGILRTKREDEASNRSNPIPLTQKESFPLTAYRCIVKKGEPAVFEVKLKLKLKTGNN